MTSDIELSDQGVTFLAFGNGAPDIFSSMAGIRQARPELVLGELFGAGIFVITIVAGAIFLVSDFKSMERPILRDILFYMLATFLTWCIFYSGRIRLWEAIGRHSDFDVPYSRDDKILLSPQLSSYSTLST